MGTPVPGKKSRIKIFKQAVALITAMGHQVFFALFIRTCSGSLGYKHLKVDVTRAYQILKAPYIMIPEQNIRGAEE